MSSTLVRINEDGSEERKFRILIDSRSALDHDNTNPSSYTMRFPEILTGVSRVRLTRYNVTMSAQYVFVRVSGWFSTLATKDTTSLQCDTIIARTADEEDGSPITIYNTTGTVQMQVHEAFSKTITASDNGDYRTYTVYLCTGRMESTSFSTDTFYLSDPTSGSGYDVPLQITGVNSDDGSDYSATRTVSSSITITTLRSEAYLRLKADTLPMTRMVQPAKAFPTWASFEVYRPGDIICYRPTASEVETDVLCYECLKSHFSLIFSEDNTAGLWQQISVSDRSAKTDGHFLMVLPEETNEHISIKELKHDQVVYELPTSTSMSEVSVEWQTRKGSEYIFPSFGTLNVYSLETSPFAYARRVFHHHQLELEIDYTTHG
jgi:hypothetical protein